MKSTQWDSSWPRLLNQIERKDVLSYLEHEFGFPPGLFMPFDLLRTSRTIYLFRRIKGITVLQDLKIQNLGLPAIRQLGKHLKPTTQFVQVFGAFAKKNVLDLDEKQLIDLAEKGEIVMPISLKKGFYIIKNGPYFWGLALLTNKGAGETGLRAKNENEGSSTLKSYLSKQMVRTILTQV